MESYISSVVFSKGVEPRFKCMDRSYYRQYGWHQKHGAFVWSSHNVHNIAHLYWRDPFDGHKASLMSFKMTTLNATEVEVWCRGTRVVIIQLCEPDSFQRIIAMAEKEVAWAESGTIWTTYDPLSIGFPTKQRNRAARRARKK